MALLTRKKVGLLHGAAYNVFNVNAVAVSGCTSVHPYKESGNFAPLSCRVYPNYPAKDLRTSVRNSERCSAVPEEMWSQLNHVTSFIPTVSSTRGLK